MLFRSGYSHPKARYFLLLRQKKVSKEKAARLPLNLRSSVLSGVGREGVLPSYRRAAFMPRPFGLIPTKPVVLGAANETKATLLRKFIVEFSISIYRSFFYLPAKIHKERLMIVAMIITAT